MYVLRAYYQSAGCEKTASVLTLLEGIVFFVPTLYMLSRISFTAVWMSFYGSDIVGVCGTVFHAVQGKHEGKENFLMLGREEKAEVVDFSGDSSALPAAQRFNCSCQHIGTFCRGTLHEYSEICSRVEVQIYRFVPEILCRQDNPEG